MNGGVDFPGWHSGPGSIAAAADHAWPSASDSDGIVYWVSETRIADVKDGTSNTYLIGEKYLNSDRRSPGVGETCGRQLGGVGRPAPSARAAGFIPAPGDARGQAPRLAGSASPDHSWPYTNPKRKRGPHNELPSLALRVGVRQSAARYRGLE